MLASDERARQRAISARKRRDDPNAGSEDDEAAAEKEAREDALAAQREIPGHLASVIIMGLTGLLCFFSMHATYVASEAYSSPSIVLSSRRADGTEGSLAESFTFTFTCTLGRGCGRPASAMRSALSADGRVLNCVLIMPAPRAPRSGIRFR